MTKQKIAFLFILIVVIAFLAMPVSAEVTELWNRTYDNGSTDYAFGVATDATGNVIVTGLLSNGTRGNYYTIKYDTEGNELWNRTYDSVGTDSAYGVATGRTRKHNRYWRVACW